MNKNKRIWLSDINHRYFIRGENTVQNGQIWILNRGRQQLQKEGVCVITGSAASPGESSHMVSLPLGGLDEAKKLQLRHGSDKPGAVEQAEEQHF